MRDQEVLRANRELSAYFKGRRTEREARAALKTIKSFVRDRERLDPKIRPELPAVNSANQPKKITKRGSRAETATARRRAPRRKPSAPSATKVVAIDTLDSPLPASAEPDEPTTR